jgi:hypothetical protein
MKALTIALALMLVTATTAVAQVGYTLDQCIKRFGPVVDQDQPPTHIAGENIQNKISIYATLGSTDVLVANLCKHYEFRKNGIAIVVGLYKGKVIAVCYLKDHGYFTPEETNVLLNLTSSGKWDTDLALSDENQLVYNGPSNLKAHMPFLTPATPEAYKFVNVFDSAAVSAVQDQCDALRDQLEKKRNQQELGKVKGL